MNRFKAKYMGLELKNPLIVSACSMTRDVSKVVQMEEAGASAIVMPSLFEEELIYDRQYIETFAAMTEGFSAEAFNFFSEPESYANLEGEEYLADLKKIKKAVSIPVIGSLNGVGLSGWTKYAKLMQDAGADAIELNIFYVPADHTQTALDIENRYLDVVRKVKSEVSIPLAVKLSPFFSSFANMAVKLDDTGADGLVLFNRFLEPDINLENKEINTLFELSSSSEMRLSLHWTAILHGRVKASVCAGRGVKNGEQLIKLIMAGADAVSVASVLYQQGIPSIKNILDEAKNWMNEHEYESFDQMRGSMSYKKLKDPTHLERMNYMKLLKSYK